MSLLLLLGGTPTEPTGGSQSSTNNHGLRWFYQALAEPVLVPAPSIFPEVWRVPIIPPRSAPRVTPEGLSRFEFEPILVAAPPSGDGGSNSDGIRWLYQGLAEPTMVIPNDTTVFGDALFQPMTQPDREGGVVIIDLRTTLVIEEAIYTDALWQPIQVPVIRRRPTRQGTSLLDFSPVIVPPEPTFAVGESSSSHGTIFLYQQLAEPLDFTPPAAAPPLESWVQPIGLPQPTKAQTRQGWSRIEFGPIIPVEISSWYQPLATPVLAKRPTLQGISLLDFAPVLVSPPLAWFEPIQQPVYAKPQTRTGLTVVDYATIIAAPAPAPELSWYQPVQQPTYRKPQTKTGLSLLEFAPIIVAPVPTMDTWWQTTQQPTYRKPQTRLGIAALDLSPIIVAPQLGWYEPIVQRPMVVKQHRYIPWSQIEVVGNTTLLMWYEPICQPTYRKPSTWEQFHQVVPSGEESSIDYPDMSEGLLIVYDQEGNPEAGVDIHIQLRAGPGADGRALDTTIDTVVSNVAGEISYFHIQQAWYRARRGIDGAWVHYLVPTTATFQIPELMGSP